ncbi:MAG: hypoxanthine phosphoribosyltransferase [Planctomycetaceae bacterium]|nr:hypoxanthine phosphoribosyltransferase [Planctomycetaceae bacterium]
MRCLINEHQIAQRIGELAAEISRDYSGKPLTLVGVLTGSLVFVADLMRRIELPHKITLLQASSYRGTATTPAKLQLTLDLLPSLVGRDVLLVDDILDTGQTLSTLVAEMHRRNAISVKTAVLLWKKARTTAAIVPDYVGFEIPDQFVVGYGLDFNDEHRHLPYIGVVE